MKVTRFSVIITFIWTTLSFMVVSLTSWQLYACSGAIEVTRTVWVKRPIAEHNKTPQRADLLHISWEVLFPCFKFRLPAWYCLMFTALYYQYLSILYCHLQASDFQQRNSLIKLFYWQFEKHTYRPSILLLQPFARIRKTHNFTPETFFQLPCMHYKSAI